MTTSGVTIVTGAAGGIGAAVVRTALERGDAVVGVDLAGCPLPEHAQLRWVRGDIADAATVDAAFAAAHEFGGVRALITAAFTDKHAPLEELTAPQIAEVFHHQAVAAWMWGTRVLAEHRPEGDTAIVHISSVHAHSAAPGKAPYAMAKAALEALTRAMAVEWGPRGVRCNAVAPGFVPVPRNAHRWQDAAQLDSITRHLPLRRVVTAVDIAECALFLAGPQAAAVTGVCLTVDAGAAAAMPDWA